MRQAALRTRAKRRAWAKRLGIPVTREHRVNIASGSMEVNGTGSPIKDLQFRFKWRKGYMALTTTFTIPQSRAVDTVWP
jgi:hypothetical protein